ncbi:hypothetical protein ACFFX0_09255 [Citricoccus parietis]|uniref:Uncharacterized protein n=1 Tax=Citricoccus parietis TaxID=592307 RepID=A0ABV5FXF3_9MICC
MPTYGLESHGTLSVIALLGIMGDGEGFGIVGTRCLGIGRRRELPCSVIGILGGGP